MSKEYIKFSLKCVSDAANTFKKYPQIKENFKTDEDHYAVDGIDSWGRKTSSIQYNYYYIYIKDINDLLKLKEVTKQDLIICDDDGFEIIIYDDYLE